MVLASEYIIQGKRTCIYRSRNYLLLSDMVLIGIMIASTEVEIICYYQTITVITHVFDLPKQKLSVTIRQSWEQLIHKDLPKQKLSVTIRHGRACKSSLIYRSRNYLLLSDPQTTDHLSISTEVEIICYYQTLRMTRFAEYLPKQKLSVTIRLLQCFHRQLYLPKQKLSVTIRLSLTPLNHSASTEVEIICYYQTKASSCQPPISTEVEIICYYQTAAACGLPKHLPKQKLSVTIRLKTGGFPVKIYRSRNYLLLSDW